MGAAIAALRRVRTQGPGRPVASPSPTGQLDIASEHPDRPQERNLLATIPLLLAKRFAQRYQGPSRRARAAGAGDDPAAWTQPGSWLEAFCQDTQAVLARRTGTAPSPVAGLIAALGAAARSPTVTP